MKNFLKSLNVDSFNTFLDLFLEMLKNGFKLEEALTYFTSNVANSLKLPSKGSIKIGNDADLLILLSVLAGIFEEEDLKGFDNITISLFLIILIINIYVFIVKNAISYNYPIRIFPINLNILHPLTLIQEMYSFLFGARQIKRLYHLANHSKFCNIAVS